MPPKIIPDIATLPDFPFFLFFFSVCAEPKDRLLCEVLVET